MLRIKTVSVVEALAGLMVGTSSSVQARALDNPSTMLADGQICWPWEICGDDGKLTDNDKWLEPT